MATLKTFPFLLLGAFFAFGATPQAGAVRPLSADIALVAGGECQAGYRDGSFTSALFNKPLGLSVSPDGTRLFVADSGNNRIRVIHLDQDNEVTTLAGQDTSGNADGLLAAAQFNDPHGVLCLPGDRLVVNDSGNNLLRLVDLTAGSVGTLAGDRSGGATLSTGPATQVAVNGIRDMAYMPSADSVFFTQPDQGSLKRLDLKTRRISAVLDKDSQLPKPAALWCQGDKLYVADQDKTQVFEMAWKGKAAPTPAALASPLAKVISLSVNGGILYSLLATPGVPAQRFFLKELGKDFTDGFNGQFNNKAVSFRNPWGDTIPSAVLFPPKDESFLPSIGFVPDPSDSRKFYVSRPDYNQVIAFRDLFGFDWNPSENLHNSNGLDAPEYPLKKPKNTYRILVVGDSRSAEVQNYTFQSDYHVLTRPKEYPFFPFNLSLAPQLDRELNLQAALDGVPRSFEVTNLSRQGALELWPTYDVPAAAQRNDIDLVLVFLTDKWPYDSYFDHPLGPDGVPRFPIDPEYVLKPPLERIPDGAPRQFYEFCKAHNLVQVSGNGLHFDGTIYNYPELHDLLVELFGKPLGVLNQKLSGLRTSGGQPVRLVLCCGFTGRAWEKSGGLYLWRDAAKKFNFSIMDLNDEMEALNLSLFPLTSDGNHFNPDGSAFFARLLAHDLIRDKWIPWGADAEKKP